MEIRKVMMLKRLFISLIILSALTAEGIINTPWNIYNLCLFINNVGSLSNGNGNAAQLPRLNTAGGGKFSGFASERRLLAESGRIGQIKYDLPLKPLLRDSLTGLRAEKISDACEAGLSCSSINYPSNIYFKIDKEIIIKISDTSPPFNKL